MIRIQRRTVGTALLASLISVAGCASGGSEPVPEAPPLNAELADAPSADQAGEDYPIAPGDLMEVRVFGAPDLSGEVRVTSSGNVSLPLLDPIRASGLTVRELEERLQDELRGSYMRDPQVNIQLLETRSDAVSTVYVLGDVQSPGGFPLERGEPITVVQALALAEGLAPTAARGDARIIRSGSNGDREEVAVHLDRVLEGTESDPLLGHRDILFVPNSRSRSILHSAWDAFIRIFTFRGIFY